MSTHPSNYKVWPVDAHFARHVVSWYAGVPAAQAAEAIGCAEARVRAARLHMRRDCELGGPVNTGTAERARATARPTDGQMSFADLERDMRSNRSVCG